METGDRLRVFISYSRKDGDFALRLHGLLKAAGFDAYLDVHDIAAGEDWRARLSGLIEAADCVVFILSPDSLASQTCAWEVERTEELAKRLLPVVYREAGSIEIPGALAKRNFVFMRSQAEEEASLEALCAAIAVDVEWLRRHTRYGERALEWDRASRASRLLLRGDDIRIAEAWRDARPSAAEITELQSVYVTDSRRASTRRQRGWIFGSSIIATGAIGLATFAVVKSIEAQTKERAATEERNRALMTESRFLADASQKRREAGDAAGAVELALWGLPKTPAAPDARPLSLEARRALYDGLLTLRETAALTGHQKTVGHVAFSPDGQHVLTASQDGFAALWRVDGGREASFGDHRGALHRALFVGDGSKVLTTAEGGLAALWRADGKLIVQLQGDDGALAPYVAASRDGRWIATGGASGQVRIWSSDGQLKQTLVGHEKSIGGLEFAPDGAILASGSSDGTIKLWSLADGEWTSAATLSDLGSTANHIAFNATGDLLAAADLSDNIAIWRRSAGEGWRLVKTVKAHASGSLLSGALALGWHPSQEIILSAGYDDVAQLWNADGTLLRTLRGHTGDVVAAEFSPDGRIVLTASRDGSAMIWDMSGRRLLTLGGGDVPLEDAGFSPDGKSVALARDDGAVRLFSLLPRGVARLSGGAGPLRKVEFSPEGRTLAIAGNDASARVWQREDPSAGEAAQTLFDQTGQWVVQPLLAAHQPGNVFFKGAAALAVSPDGQQVLTGGFDGITKIHDIKTQSAQDLTGHSNSIVSAAFAPTGDVAATASRDGTVRLWRNGLSDATSGWSLASEIKLGSTSAREVVFMPDGLGLVTLAQDKFLDPSASVIEVWKFSPGDMSVTRSARIAIEARGAMDIDLDPPGKRIGVARMDGSIEVYELSGRLVARSQRAHGGQPVLKVVFSKDADIFASVAGDAVARIWRIDAGEVQGGHSLNRITELIGHQSGGLLQGGIQSGIADIDFAQDNRMIATAGRDGTVKVWTMDGSVLGVLRGGGTAEDVTFNAKGSLIATAWSDGFARVFPAPPPIAGLLSSGRQVVERLRPLSAIDRCLVFLQTSPCDQSFRNAEEARAAGDYAAAAQHMVSRIAAAERLTPAARAVLATDYGVLAFDYLFAREFAKAEAAARQGLTYNPDAHWIAGNLAHAALLQGQVKEAKAIYMQNAGRQLEIGMRWESAVADDFAKLTAAGIKRPEFRDVLQELGVFKANASGGDETN